MKGSEELASSPHRVRQLWVAVMRVRRGCRRGSVLWLVRRGWRVRVVWV